MSKNKEYNYIQLSISPEVKKMVDKLVSSEYGKTMGKGEFILRLIVEKKEILYNDNLNNFFELEYKSPLNLYSCQSTISLSAELKDLYEEFIGIKKDLKLTFDELFYRFIKLYQNEELVEFNNRLEAFKLKVNKEFEQYDEKFKNIIQSRVL